MTQSPEVLIIGDASLRALLPEDFVITTSADVGAALAGGQSESAAVIILAARSRADAERAAQELEVTGTPVVCLLPEQPGSDMLPLLRAGISECLTRVETSAPVLAAACARAMARAAGRGAPGGLYRTLVDRVADPVIAFDQDMRITFVSAGATRLTGWQPAEALGRMATEFAPPEGLAMLLDAVRWVMDNPGKHYQSHGPICHRAGHLVRVEGSLINLLDEPSVRAIVISFRDAATRDEQTRRLQRDEARFRAIAEDTPVPVWLEDAERNLIYENRTALEFVGRKFADEEGTGWLDTVHPDDLPAVLEHYRDRPNDLRAVSLEFRMRRHDGDWRNVMQIAIPRIDERSRVVGYLGVDVDITDLKTKAARTEAAEERYRMFVERSAEGIWRFEVIPPIPTDLSTEEQIRQMASNGVLAECNRAMARQYGREEAADMLGAHLTDLMDPAEPKNSEFLTAFVNGGYQIVDAESHEFDRHHRRVVFLNTLIGFVENGKLVRVWGLQRDVTERMQLEEEARQARKMETAGRLAGGIAHDFNNLLTAILGTSELLLADLDPESGQRADVEEIKRAATRAAGLTHQLLAFSRRQVLQPRILDLNNLVSGVESLLRRLIGEHIQLSTQLAPGPWRVQADPGQLEQVIVNLCVNARDAMPTGGALTVATSNVHRTSQTEGPEAMVEPGHYVLLSVTDSGVGMDTETRLHLFEPFFTTKELGKGTGLGLATVYGIIKQSGGYIFADSSPGEGSRFRIYLPRAEGEAVSVAPAPVRSTETAQGTILLVEDEESVRRLGRRILEGVGYRVLEAADGAEALAVAEAWQGDFDLVITDVIMPEMSGQMLSARLRERSPGLRILYVSGYTDDAILQHGQLLPNTGFLQKPFTPTSLLQRVQEVLRT